ncbi:MAG TPA: histidine kinase, partial [Syntrophobacteraceae bacterium]|nr:histidine kinase [Syntrophobacteraceae bacterium]
MLHYKVLEIFTSEEARCHGKPLHSAIVEQVRDLKIAARTMVTRGIEGSYESGEMATGRLEVLSYNMPLRITVIVPATDFDRVLSTVEEMVADGIIAARDVDVISHKTRGLLMPRHTKVREIMTPAPKTVATTTTLDEVARALLSSTFTGLPVVDEENHPVGVLSQGDLIYKAGMPMRLGLLAESDGEKVGPILEALAPKRAREVMTQPAISIAEDSMVTEAVDLMLEKQVKRLPVVDTAGKLVGILSRVDVFRTVMKESPDWTAFREQNILVEGLHFVSDIMRRDAHTVLPDTPVEEVMRVIDGNDIQRICVVDKEGRFLGIISDRDLLIAFSNRHPGIWDYFASKIPFTERGRRNRELREHLRARMAADVMNTDIVTVREDAPINDAIRLMLDRAIKRLPVLDA